MRTNQCEEDTCWQRGRRGAIWQQGVARPSRKPSTTNSPRQPPPHRPLLDNALGMKSMTMTMTMTMTTPTSSTCAGQCTGYEESFKSLQKGRWSRSRTVTVQSNLSTSVVNTSKKALLKTARTKDGVHSGKVEEQQRHVGRGCFSWHCSKQRATLKETPTDQYVDIQERLLTSTSCYLLTYKRRTEL